MTHRHALRVYYEDTDLAGIVYYANYLKFIERGRSEWIAALGVDQMALRAAEGIVFAVRRVDAEYLRAARFGDDLRVTTDLIDLGGSRIELGQEVAFRPTWGRACSRSRMSRCRKSVRPDAALRREPAFLTAMCWQSPSNPGRITSIGGQQSPESKEQA